MKKILIIMVAATAWFGAYAGNVDAATPDGAESLTGETAAVVGDAAAVADVETGATPAAVAVPLDFTGFNPTDTVRVLRLTEEELIFAETPALPCRKYRDGMAVNYWQLGTPVAVGAVASLFVKTPKLVQAREYVQKHLSQHGKHKTTVDNYLQYAPIVASYGLFACGLKGENGLLDRTIIAAMSYTIFVAVNAGMKFAFGEKRPDSNAHNSFPSGHTGTAVTGAELLRREYWSTSPWIGVAGYAVALTTAYLRIHNDRHWINDVVGGAAVGYFSTTLAYWLYPKIFRKRYERHTKEREARLARECAGIDLPKRRSGGVTGFGAPFAGGGAVGFSMALNF